MSARSRSRRRVVLGRLLRYGLPALGLVVLATAWLGLRAYTVARDLTEARATFSLVSAQLGAGRTLPVDLAGVRARLADVSARTASARAATQDPLWRLAAAVPLAGNSLRTVSALAESSDLLGSSALPAVADAMAAVDAAQTSPPERRLAGVEGAARSLRTALAEVEVAGSTAQASPASWLLPPVQAARAAFAGQVAEAQRRLSAPADVTAVLPRLLGADGPRTYFVAFTNPAELRGSGGLLGAYALLRADRGSLSVPTLGANSTLPDLPVGPVGMPADWEARYLRYGSLTDWNQSNTSPDFPSNGRLWQLMYRTATGTTVDGVLQLDPAALAVLLRSSGPVRAAGQQVTSENVEDFLLRGQYELPLSPERRERVLDDVGRAAVSRLLERPSGTAGLLQGLSAAAGSGHVRFWSGDPEVQRVVERYPIGGQVPGTSQPFGMAVLNNAASGKLDTYLDSSLRYAVGRCSPTGRAVTYTVQLRNTAPRSGLPAYVTQRADSVIGVPGVPQPVTGQNRTLLSVFLTRGARLASATLDGRPVTTRPGPGGSYAPWLQLASERGHPVVSTFLELPPGQPVTLVLQVDEPPSTAPPLLLAQPTARPQVLTATGSCAGG